MGHYRSKELDDVQAAFAIGVYRRRLELKLTQVDLAKRLAGATGLKVGNLTMHVSRIETGESCRLPMALAIADALGRTPLSLIQEGRKARGPDRMSPTLGDRVSPPADGAPL